MPPPDAEPAQRRTLIRAHEYAEQARQILLASQEYASPGMLLTDAQKAMCPLTWQAAYTQLHSRMMALPPEEQRLIVFDGVNGMYDR